MRRAVSADAAALADLNGRAFAAAYGAYVPVDTMRPVLAGLSASWRSALATRGPERETWVLDDGSIAGFVSLGRSRDADVPVSEGELRALYVEPSRVGGGLGARLHDHALARLAALGYARASLWVFEANEGARAFYAARTWRRDERPFDRDRWGWAPSVRLVRELPRVGKGRSDRHNTTHARGSEPAA